MRRNFISIINAVKKSTGTSPLSKGKTKRECDARTVALSILREEGYSTAECAVILGITGNAVRKIPRSSKDGKLLPFSLPPYYRIINEHNN